MIRLTFERVGRTHNPPPVDIDRDPDDAVFLDDVYRAARRYLRSREFGVVIYEAEDSPNDDGVRFGDGSIDGGRFGKFVWRTR